MKVELQRFVEFNDKWYAGDKTRAAMVFEPLLIELKYVSWCKRYPMYPGVELCEISMVDHGRRFVVDKSYEEMKQLLEESDGNRT